MGSQFTGHTQQYLHGSITILEKTTLSLEKLLGPIYSLIHQAIAALILPLSHRAIVKPLAYVLGSSLAGSRDTNVYESCAFKDDQIFALVQILYPFHRVALRSNVAVEAEGIQRKPKISKFLAAVLILCSISVINFRPTCAESSQSYNLPSMGELIAISLGPKVKLFLWSWYVAQRVEKCSVMSYTLSYFQMDGPLI